MACFPVQHKEVAFVLLSITNNFVLHFENRQTSYPIHMININIILSTKYRHSIICFFNYGLREVSVLQSNKFWVSGITTCQPKSTTCFQLFTISNYSFGSLQAQAISTVTNINTHLQNVVFTWKVSGKGITEKHPFKPVNF